MCGSRMDQLRPRCGSRRVDVDVRISMRRGGRGTSVIWRKSWYIVGILVHSDHFLRHMPNGRVVLMK